MRRQRTGTGARRAHGLRAATPPRRACLLVKGSSFIPRRTRKAARSKIPIRKKGGGADHSSKKKKAGERESDTTGSRMASKWPAFSSKRGGGNERKRSSITPARGGEASNQQLGAQKKGSSGLSLDSCLKVAATIYLCRLTTWLNHPKGSRGPLRN